jgi:hypothetical protein
MPENAWFYGNPGANAYDISEHVRRSLWFMGYRQAWFDCTQADPPYAGTLRWRDQELTVEWEPRQYLIVRLQRDDKDIVQGFSAILGFQPQFQYQDSDGRSVFEWRRIGLKARAEELTGMAGVENLKQLR